MKPDIVTQKSLVRVYLPSIHVRWRRSLHFFKTGFWNGIKQSCNPSAAAWVSGCGQEQLLGGTALTGLTHHTGLGGQAGAKEIWLCPEKTLLAQLG